MNVLDLVGGGTHIWNGARRAIDAVGALEPVARAITPLRKAAQSVSGSWASKVHNAARPFIQSGTAQRAKLLEGLDQARQFVLKGVEPDDPAEFLATFNKAFEAAPANARLVDQSIVQQQRNMLTWIDTQLPEVPQQIPTLPLTLA